MHEQLLIQELPTQGGDRALVHVPLGQIEGHSP
jgi:hypothetical protein